MDVRGGIRRILKALALAAAAAAGLALLAILLLQFRPVRIFALDRALALADASLPGTIEVRDPDWPSPGSLRLDGASWTDGADTLAAARRLHVSVDLPSLLRRDLHLREISAAGLLLDVPAIAARLAGGGAADGGPESPAKEEGGGFPREGSIAGAPSIVADTVAVDARRVRLTRGFEMRGVRLGGSADLRAGRPPVVDIAALSIESTSAGISIDSMRLRVDLSAPAAAGSGIARLPGDRRVLLSLRADRDGSFGLVLSGRGAPPPDDPGLALSGNAVLAGGRLESIDAEVRFMIPGTGELRTIPPLSEALAPIGDLEGISGRAGVSAGFAPSLDAAFSLELAGNAWLDTLHLSGTYAPPAASIDTLLLAMPGLRAGAHASLGPRTATAFLSLAIEGTRWLSRIVPGAGVPADAAADLSIRGTLDRETGTAAVALRGTGRIAGVAVDTLIVDATAPAGGGGPIEADLTVGAFGIDLVTHALAGTSDGIELSLSPPADRPAGPGTAVLGGRLRAGGPARSIAVDSLRLAGALGEVMVDAAVDSLGEGRVELRGEWASIPPPLAAALGAGTDAFDSVRSRWREDGPFRLEVRGELGRRGSETTFSADGEAILPGPRVFAPLAGAGDALDDLGPLRAGFSGRYAGGGIGGVTGIVDLSRTAWIDTMAVSLAGGGGAASIDAALRIEGVRLSAAGLIEGDRLDIDAALSMADLQMVDRIGKLAGREISLALDGGAAIEGTLARPRVTAALAGRLSAGGVDIPALSANVRSSPAGLAADLSATEGLFAGPVSFDSVGVELARSAAGTEDTIRAEGWGPDTRLLLALRSARGEGLRLNADTLHAELSGKTLSSRRPFALERRPDGALGIDGLSMAGSIGRIDADGTVLPGSSDLTASAQIVLPDRPASLALADRLWPDTVSLDARLAGASRIAARGHISGVSIGKEGENEIDLSLDSDSAGASVSLTISGPGSPLLRASGKLPPLTVSGPAVDGPFALDLVFDGLPLAAGLSSLLSESPDEIGRLSGRISARGRFPDPEAVADLSIRFTGKGAIGRYDLAVRGRLSRDGISDTTLQRLLGEGPPPDRGGGGGGLSAGLTLSRSGRPVMTGSLSYPAIPSLRPLSLALRESAGMSLGLRADSLSLTDLDPLLPADVHLAGSCSIELSADGPARNPALAGRLRTRRMSLSVSNDLDVYPAVDLALGGDLEGPSVTGTVTIEQGQLRIPESGGDLLPAEGEAVLWTAADTAAAGADPAAAPEEAGSAAGGGAPLRGLELDVTVSVPGSFRVWNDRIDLSLGGSLRISQTQDGPAVTGELSPREGRLLFMGRSFRIQRGSVYFYGDDQMNPSFDLTLTATVSETEIRIHLTGTADAPRIELSSDPDMPESDIMSLLLFGRPVGDLDRAQQGLLRQRTAEVLLAFGAARLEAEMSRELGVDVFTFRQATREPDRTALVIGKYLNRRTLLKYEQGLESAAGFLINLEYYLTLGLKIETYIDQASETGVEINWSREY